MTLHFKEEQYHWGDSFYILDDANQRKYRVKTSVLLFKRSFKLYDLDKNLLAVIRNEPKSLLKKKFYIEIGDRQIAAVTKEISLMPKFTIEGLDWQMHGVMRHEYEILKDGQEVLSFHMENTPWGHRPVLRVPSPSNELAALAFVLAVSYAIPATDSSEASTNHL